MKRYWKMVVLVLFIILCIGTYYVEAAGSNPEFILKYQEGNENEASPISLQGYYRSEGMVSINSEGSEYQSEQSFWKSLEPSYDSKELNKLLKEHRQFMRGKSDPHAIYEDDRIIGYATIKSQFIRARGMSDFRFAVSTYDKDRKESLSFEVKVPEENVYSEMNLDNVQIDGNTMKIITFNFKRNEKMPRSNTNEIHLYTLDLNKKNVLVDKVLSSGLTLNEGDRVMGADEMDLTKPSRFAIFQIVHVKKEMRGDSQEIYFEPIFNEFLVYDMKNDKSFMIQDEPLNGFLKGTSVLVNSHSGDDLFLLSLKDPQEPRVIRYSLAENKIKSDLTISRNDLHLEKGTVSLARIANNRLYMLMNTGKEDFPVTYPFAIAELDTGGIVYQGIVTRKDNNGSDLLRIHNILIK